MFIRDTGNGFSAGFSEGFDYMSITITGVKEIDRVLRNLPKELSHQIVGAANMAAAKPLVIKEKLLAPEGPTGNLVDSIGAVKTPMKKANSVGEVVVGPRRNGGHKGFAGHLVEYGTKRRQTKKGANRGIMPKDPFAEPAFEQTKDAVEQSIRVQLGKKLISRMKKELGSAYVKG
jgi:HK97 gp10 family phage protein